MGRGTEREIGSQREWPAAQEAVSTAVASGLPGRPLQGDLLMSSGPGSRRARRSMAIHLPLGCDCLRTKEGGGWVDGLGSCWSRFASEEAELSEGQGFPCSAAS